MGTKVVTVTTKELLQIAAERLEGITGIPVSMANDVARPIWESVQEIRAVINAMPDPEPEASEAETEQTETEGTDNGAGNGVSV